MQLIDLDPHALGVALGDAHGHAMQDRAKLALEIAHAGLPRVVADDGADRVLLDLGLLGREAGGRELARHQIALGDLDLLVLGVAGKLDHLHAVAQRPGDLVEHVGRADEHHPRQIERHREIVVAERGVLLGVEHLEQGGRRVAVEALAQLVHLVEHHHGVARPGLRGSTG